MAQIARTPTEQAASGGSEFHAERNLELTARQRELFGALRAGPNPGLTLAGYGGAMGGGKTKAIVELAIDAALAFPGNNVLVARQHYTDLSATTMKEFYAACPPEFLRQRVSAPTPLARLGYASAPASDWSTVNFRHLSDWQGLGSQQYGSVLIDEAGQVDEEAALMLLTRLRHPAQPQRWFVAASNPWPGWFQRWFVGRELPEDALQAAQGQVSFIPARIEDNPHLPQNYAELNHALMPPRWRERFIEGRFDALMGRVYPDFDPNRHRWEQPLPHFTRYIGGLDFGGQTETAHYTAGIVAGLFHSDPLSPRERARVRAQSPFNLIRLAEFEDRGPGVIQRLEQWQRRCQQRFGRIRWAADRSQSAWIDHQKRQGMDVVPAAGSPGSVLYGVNLVHERVASEPPTSFYMPDLTQFPLRMSEYVWEQREDDPDPKPRKRNDDLLDADRYMHELLQQVPRSTTGPDIVILNGPRGKMAHWPGR